MYKDFVYVCITMPNLRKIVHGLVKISYVKETKRKRALHVDFMRI